MLAAWLSLTGAGAVRHPLANGCRYVFLDVGSNIGRHVQFLFEPERFPRSRYAHEIFPRIFPADTKRQDVCAFGFEPNARHKAVLGALQSRYLRRGWRVNFSHVAASTSAAPIHFRHVDVARKPRETGFSAKVWPATARRGNTSVETVEAIDISAWIIENVHRRAIPNASHPGDPPPAVVMKMDIEGGEYDVLGKMLLMGALCNITLVTLEWHPALCDACDAAVIERMLNSSLSAKECASSRIIQFDDESYA